MEDRFTNFEDRNIEILQVKEQREPRLKKNEDICQEVSHSIRKCNIRIIGIQEGEGREKGAEILSKKNNSLELLQPGEATRITSK